MILPGAPFEYAFLNDVFDRIYRREETQGRVFAAFALLAIVIACSGLLGLAGFTAEARRKEISIRKVLGASTTQIFSLLTWSYGRLLLGALILAVPITYVAMSRWLDEFVHRIHIGPGVFVTSGLVVAGAAFLTVAYQTGRAALANPVASLRSDA